MTPPIVDRVYLVRHAKAGSRHGWAANDTARELTPAGWEQARILATRLGPLVGAGRLLSSPFLRCQQTIEPLIEALNAGRPASVASGEFAIETLAALAESMPVEPVLGLVGTVAGGSVICSHGDVIPDTIAALDRRHCHIVGVPHWEKASTWILERLGDGTVIRAWSWAPPA